MLITKIEAKQACDWLVAAGFPQYAQLFKDCRFPIDLDWAKSDHAFLEKDAIDSLCRRLITLNKCVEMNQETGRMKRRSEESDDEEPCAISSKWTFNHKNSSWVRRVDSKEELKFLAVPESPRSSTQRNNRRATSPSDNHDEGQEVCSTRSSSSFDSDGAADGNGFKMEEEEDGLLSQMSRTMPTSLGTFLSSPSSPSHTPSCSSGGPLTPVLAHKPPHKKGPSLLRKMERLRLRGPSKGGSSGSVADVVGAGSNRARSRSLGRNTRLLISGPVLLDGPDQERLRQLNCLDIAELKGKAPMGHRVASSFSSASSSSSSSASSTPASSPSASSGSASESGSVVSTPSPVTRVRGNIKRNRAWNQTQGPNQSQDLDQENQDQSMIQNENKAPPGQSEQDLNNQRNQCSLRQLYEETLFRIPEGYKPGTFPTALAHGLASPLSPIDDPSVNWRTGSFHGYHNRRCRGGGSGVVGDAGDNKSPLAAPAVDHRASIYDNVPPDATPLPPAARRLIPDEPPSLKELGSSLDEDVFRALDCVMERINSLQQLVSTWADKLSEDGDSDFSNHSSSSPSLNDIHLEIKEPEVDEEDGEGEEEEKDNAGEDSAEPTTTTTQMAVPAQLHWLSEQQEVACLSPDLGMGMGLEGQGPAQMNRLQRLSLLHLTALMDRYSPSCKQGWIWTGPNVQCRSPKKSHHKHRKVFGVPLLRSVQAHGTPLPPSILRAMQYLKTECLNQVGLFRKPGVKSRIQSLREMVEADPDGVSFEGQSAFDVADMVKQYFRDLPEPVFSEKLNESFLHIYQYFPKEQHFPALRAAILLLPDEHREALHSLLLFLREVTARVEENQMTPTNVAVCLAPSLFHLCSPRRDQTRHGGTRKHSLVKPDQRDLSESLAATQGLAHMLTEVSRLFKLPAYSLPKETQQEAEEEDEEEEEEKKSQGEVEEEEAKEKEESQGQQQQKQREPDAEECLRLRQSAQQLLKEAREKARGWVSCPSMHQHVDLAYKKMEDGQALRLWRGSVEVECPGQEVLQRLLREPGAWGCWGSSSSSSSTTSRGQQRGLELLGPATVLETLDKDAHICSYTLQGAGSRPPLQHVLLRTWQTDPSSGPLYVASESRDHPDAPLQGLRARVHTCLYLVEPLGSKRSRLTHFCRTDTRGRSSAWHNRVCGHQLAHGLQRARDCFKNKAKDGRS
ncbi:rho GTPase-activating protein 7 isoform X2 [Engraulis encrasicolus]|uniref:rho GTPase-activating protein 7 isoform X2 n=1 Tax=Engraulis encrasicolus TaxID=184585 RepID=UPI002FCF494A